MRVHVRMQARGAHAESTHVPGASPHGSLLSKPLFKTVIGLIGSYGGLEKVTKYCSWACWAEMRSTGFPLFP